MHRPKASFRIRRASEDDAQALAILSGDLGYTVDAQVLRSRLRAILRSAVDLLLVAEDASGSGVGWLQAHAAHVVESGFRVEVTGLIVSATSRRRGVGRALLAEAEQWAREISAEAVVVRSNVRRVESHSFYPALGYTSTKTQRVYRKLLPDAKFTGETGASPGSHKSQRGDHPP